MNKYRNQRCVFKGEKFDSKREMMRWIALCDMQQKGEIDHLRRQVPYTIIVNKNKICRYIADFVYDAPIDPESGSWNLIEVVEDAKGMRTPVYQLKRKLMRAVLGIEIREV